MFGLELSLAGVVTLGLAVIGAIGGWYKLTQQLENILARNTRADYEHAKLDAKVDTVEMMLRAEINRFQKETDGRITLQEDRLRAADIHGGRMEEKLNSLSEQQKRVLDILERKFP
jgi:uncharacterized protein HemX